MPLQSLYESIATLRGRIERHAANLRQSEMLTRYALVDPLLRELGWDTEDPDLVRPEYKSGTGSADYALLRDGKPVMMVEAKKLDTPLRDNVLAQGIQYCLMQGTPYFAVTDGRKWEIYETHKAAPIDEKRVVAFDVADATPSEAVLKALALWRPNVETGNVALPQAPLVTSSTSTTPEPVTQPPSVAGDLPVLSRSQLSAMPDGQLALCPSRPEGVEFLKKYNAWGFLSMRQTPKYLALYISAPISAIQYFGEVDQVIDPLSPESPVRPEDSSRDSGKKLVLLKKGKLWRLEEPIPLGAWRPGKAPQGLRLLSLSNLAKAATLDDL